MKQNNNNTNIKTCTNMITNNNYNTNKSVVWNNINNISVLYDVIKRLLILNVGIFSNTEICAKLVGKMPINYCDFYNKKYFFIK